MSIEGVTRRLAGKFEGTLLRDEPMARHTTYRIGGPAALYAVCTGMGDLELLLSALAEERVAWTVVGRGSDLLVADAGYGGCIIVLGGAFEKVEFPATECPGDDALPVRAGAGVSLTRLARECAERGLSGLEFAAGIPGTLGGALFMNAGAHECAIGSIVVTITCYVRPEGLIELPATSVDWGYRRGLQRDGAVIVGATLKVDQGDGQAIVSRMRAYLDRRKAAQPLEYPSCGSVFRNPEGDHAARLISACGLKGTACGGARISEKHANFIVNEHDASAEDVRTLIELVQERVKEKYAIELQPELRFLGFPQ
ncbi:MAG: UDP-N-acetylmuramate dehydrogenase [Coriobacteriales bacterium]